MSFGININKVIWLKIKLNVFKINSINLRLLLLNNNYSNNNWKLKSVFGHYDTIRIFSFFFLFYLCPLLHDILFISNFPVVL